MRTDFRVSTIREAMDTKTEPYSFRMALEEIQSTRWMAQVEEVRRAFKAGGKDAAAAPKKKLPGVLFSGTFTKRSKEALIQHSGLICVDLDGLGDRVEATRDLIAQDPHTLAAFISPTGTGLKVVFRCDPAKDHYLSFRAAGEYVLRHFGLEIDEACKDVNRICFVSHDPDLFAADDAEMLPYPEPVKEFHVPLDKPKLGIPETTPGDDYDSRGDVFAVLRSHGWVQVGKNGWRRPDKSDGVSATFDKVPGRFYVFTNSTQFQANHVYKPWHVYAILECGGDFREAARRLGRNGYGAQQPLSSAPIQNNGAAHGLIAENWDDEPAITVNEPTKKETPDERYERIIKESLYRDDLIIPKPTPIFTAAGTTICTPGNLAAYYSQAKAGKTAIIGAMIGATMELPGAVNDTLGFKGPNTAGKAVIHFDTEQSRYDWQQMIRTAKRRVKMDQTPPWLRSHILTGLTAGECRIVADKIIARYAKEFGGIYAIFFDGIGDLVTDVNEPKECNELIAHLHGLAILHDTAIINVLHMNAGNESEKGRGHLGSQLERKAESNITMEKVDGISSYWGIKQRGKSIPKDGAPSFQWSDDAQMHISCAATPPEKKKSKGGSAKKYHFAPFAGIFSADPLQAKTRHASYRFTKDISDLSESSWRDLLTEAVQNGELCRITKPDGYYYHLPVI